MPKPSLVAQQAAKAAEPLDPINLPALPASVQVGSIEVGDPGAQPGGYYIGFLHSRSSNYQRSLLEVPGVQEGDPILTLPNGLVKLAPFKFFLLQAKHYWASISDAGLLVETSAIGLRDRPELKEHIDTIMLAFLPDGKLAPATCTFKTTKIGAAHKIVQAIKLAATEGWFKLSPAHAATATASQPWLRVTATVSVRPYIGKASGRKSFIADSVVNPSQAADWVAVVEFFKDEANKDVLSIVGDNFNKRMAEVKAKMKS